MLIKTSAHPHINAGLHPALTYNALSGLKNTVTPKKMCRC